MVRCSNQSHLPSSASDTFSPPGTVKVSDNFYCDQTEISNLDWQEYVYWTKDKYGENSAHHLECLPDTSDWNGVNPKFSEPFQSNRFKHPAYNFYPVVGITKKQAADYTYWRTERVIEILLINDDLITSESLHSISLNELINSQSSLKIRLVPVYRIPSQKEVNYINLTYKSLKNEFQEELGRSF